MTKNEILETLNSLGNEKRKQMYIKNGADTNTYGVLLGELRKLAKQVGTNHQLALELWQSGNTDARWLACMLFQAKELTMDEIKSMVSQVTYPALIDKFIGEVIFNHKDADFLAREWSVSEKDNLGRAGWELIALNISDGKQNHDELEEILTTVTRELQTATPGKQWAMNHALCEIGICYPMFTERCIKLGETLGVYKDLKVAKGCTSAYAPNWINAVVNKRKK
ncbi:DNA alkylation repair protein [Anaerocolumna cellulosilytica]|uniref:DNA alkylation repair protein n=1 Tax=Anaerocolumna cellulosilytica TaxID=433286 RepID=A0A6S6QVX5_9FIRM|nr:DNA alkylation repair protein [Anaerocolumna cellulosilytica]MBB5195612.1 3-methyladenine DNA glycosylase AlkD [Anaerocolumna cellulosilytica]BCJ93856.1 DNA alkylation repair protein [Anaerocolumna cellulosilytica]